MRQSGCFSNTELKGKFDGYALRVPTPTVSIVDFVANVENQFKEELNDLSKLQNNTKRDPWGDNWRIF